jgi:hypothetical protein
MDADLETFLWRTSPSLDNSRVGYGGEELMGLCTYLHLGLVASAVTVTFELKNYILLVAMGYKLHVIHFQLAPL